MKAFRNLLVRTLLSAIIVALGITAAQAGPSTTIVISQVYGGGGNSGATYKNDFIELHNISSSPVVISNWSVQYASATGTSWQVTTFSTTIQPGAYFLIQEASQANVGSNLPTADATGTINLSASAGKVALCNNNTALSGSAPTDASIVDLVGFGSTASAYEGTGPAPAPASGNGSSDLRANNGNTDTNDNSSDFSSATVSPRNSSSPANQLASKVRVETLANGSGAIVSAQSVAVGTPVVSYAVARTSADVFTANVAATWSLTSKTGGIVDSDLVVAGDSKSATFTPHAAGSAVIHAVISNLTSVDSGVITATEAQTNPSMAVTVDSQTAANGQNVTITVTVTPGSNPSSTGITVTGNLSAIGGSSTQAFTAGPNNTFTYQTTIPTDLAGGVKNLTFTVGDDQSRTGTGSLDETVRGNITIFHTNDTHARVTPHKWIVPAHTSGTTPVFEDVGGIAYMGAKVLSLTTAQPDALVLDGGDISEGNPIGDWNGPGHDTGTYGDGTIVDYFKMLDTKLKAIPGRGGRGLDAMVVGNHDIRDVTYFQNMLAASSQFPIISMNICQKGTHTPYYKAYTIVNVNGNKIGIVGYTTESSDSPESDVNNLIDVVKCDWSSSDSTKIHFADIVNDLRNNQGCNLVILLTHMGHSGLCTPTSANPTPILVDNAVAKLPEIAVTGHWHTYAETIWQPTSLNYKTIFTEAGSFQHYVGELRVNGLGKYTSSAYYPLRTSAITPDPDIASYLQTRKDQYAATNPPYGVDQIIGYTSDDLLLDNYMKWWSADEYPWSGNNTAGNWICDAVQWKAAQLFGQCDLSIESGGGVRSDIVTGPIKYTNIYETFPWPDDTIYMVNMTGQEIWNYFKQHGCDAALSRGWHVTAYDGDPTQITYNDQPIDLAHTYKVAINNYMYLHDTVPFSDPSPQTSTYLARTALVDFTSQYPQENPYNAGPSRYSLNTEFSGGYRAVITMMNDADSSESFKDGFIRFIGALPETLAHRGTQQVPADLVNADGSMNRANRLVENEWYRSYLGFRTGVLKPGDIVEIWGKGSFYQGDPEFVDSEGVQSDGVEFKIVGHDDSLAQPTYFSSIAGFWDQVHKNHYVKFFAKKTGSSTVTDNSGTTITVQDATAYSTKTLPGSVGDLLMITGVPTSENFALRFRCDKAVLASSVGVSSYPPDSQVNPPAPVQTAGTLSLAANAAIAPGSNQNFYTLEPVADAQVESGVPNSNFGTSTNLFIESTSAGTFKNERAWLRFDLSGIPAGATITSAKLNMFCWRTAGASLPVSAHGGNDDSWAETAITWNSQPTFGTALDTQTLATGVENVTYTWDATAFVQTKFAGNKLASLLVKPVTEDSADATAPSYGFDSKEYTANHPYLQVITPAAGTPSTVSQVQYFYRYSADSSNWGSWTASQTTTTTPWTASFTYPQGEGYYEFYSVATDSTGAVEPAPPFADASVFYAPAASNVSSSGATLNGSLNPNGLGTTIHFEYGTDASYGQSTAPFDIGNGSAPVPFNLDLAGLQHNTTYHYRLVSVTNGVTTTFADQTFTTSSDVPAMSLWGRILLPLALLVAIACGLARKPKKA